MQKDMVSPVSADVFFASSRFPNYKIGANNQIVEVKEDSKTSSMKDMVARETALLLEQQKRLSVRDLASKFEKGLAAAAKLSDEARLKEAASLEKHVLLKKLRDALEALRGRVAGKNKDDVEEAIAMVEALAVQLTQREGELIQEKAEVKKLATFLKQASEDAKKLVDEERAFARAEIENARAAVQRVEEALQEHEQMSRASGKQDVDELMKEVQEARRIKMLHQPSRVMDMEHELQALRIQLAEKSKHSLQLQKEILEDACVLMLEPLKLVDLHQK
ncbi:UNVERIFIED_CONTAM: Stomatal closure-related actin-binding protein 1 [Sesamum radiatum]|uniref:Stomatal closure-related actin-binding protein 1 n=1 Tax=Sesamum radiatum TaxID=300843 RepID=A0AAW2URE8_SESRA